MTSTVRPFDEISNERHETVTSVSDISEPRGSSPTVGPEGQDVPPDSVLRVEGSRPLMPLRRFVISIALMVGVVLAPGVVVTIQMMFVVGRLSDGDSAKVSGIAGSIYCALSTYDLTNTFRDLVFWLLARSRARSISPAANSVSLALPCPSAA